MSTMDPVCTKEKFCDAMDTSDSGSGSGSGDDDTSGKVCCTELLQDLKDMGVVLDICSAKLKSMLDALPADAKTAADAEQKKEYDAKAAAWTAGSCDTYSGKSFSSLADSAGYKDSITAMPASSWFTSAFGLLLALWISYMK